MAKRKKKKRRGRRPAAAPPRGELAFQDLVAQLVEAMEAGEPCSRSFALEAEEVAATTAEDLTAVAEMGRDGLGMWPDTKSTAELRTLLFAMAQRALDDAQAWHRLAQQFGALGREGPHVHVDDDGRARAADDHDVIDIESIDVPV